MKKMAAVVVLGVGTYFGGCSVPPSAHAAPATPPSYVSCPGGYIAPTWNDCPPWKTPISVYPGKGGGKTGSGGGGGLLGTIGRIVGGIGGLGGL